jgi:uncharacterized membrane protein
MAFDDRYAEPLIVVAVGTAVLGAAAPFYWSYWSNGNVELSWLGHIGVFAIAMLAGVASLIVLVVLVSFVFWLVTFFKPLPWRQQPDERLPDEK